MNEGLICCQSIKEGEAVGASPFLMIALDYYDGPVSGFAKCLRCSAEYQFIMLDWEQYRAPRIYALVQLHAQSFDRIVNLLDKHEPPKWHLWVPSLDDAQRESIGKYVNSISANIEPPIFVIATSQWGETILAAKILDSSDTRDIIPWFLHEESSYDWFSFLGLLRQSTT